MSRPAFFVFAWRQGLKAKRVLPSSATLPTFYYCKRFEDCVHRLKVGLLWPSLLTEEPRFRGNKEFNPYRETISR